MGHGGFLESVAPDDLHGIFGTVDVYRRGNVQLCAFHPLRHHDAVIDQTVIERELALAVVEDAQHFRRIGTPGIRLVGTVNRDRCGCFAREFRHVSHEIYLAHTGLIQRRPVERGHGGGNHQDSCIENSRESVGTYGLQRISFQGRREIEHLSAAIYVHAVQSRTIGIRVLSRTGIIHHAVWALDLGPGGIAAGCGGAHDIIRELCSGECYPAVRS